MITIGSSAIRTLRKTMPSRSRMRRTVAMLMISSALSKALVESTLMAALPVSPPVRPEPDR